SRKKYFLAFAHNKGGDGGMKEYTTEEQNELIAKEVDRINSIFIDLPESKREVAKELIERIAFMTIQMKIMEETIKEKGPTYLFINGSQQMLVENPAQKSYNTSMNRYTAAYDKLFNLLVSWKKLMSMNQQTYKYHPYIDEYMRMVENEEVESCREQKQLMDFLKWKLDQPNVVIDHEAINNS